MRAPLRAPTPTRGAALTAPAAAAWNCFGVGRTGGCKLPLPWTGGTTAYDGGCHNFNESVIVEIAEVMASKLRVAGYEYVNLDCGYSTKRRDAQGKLVVNTTRYPHGMTWLGERIHSLGLKFGMCARQHPSAPHGHPAAPLDPSASLKGHAARAAAQTARWAGASAAARSTRTPRTARDLAAAGAASVGRTASTTRMPSCGPPGGSTS